MIQSVKNNWRDSLTEVIASLSGTLGIILLIAIVLSRQNEQGVFDSFYRYFNEGQIGLSALSITGVIFISLTNHGNMNSLKSFIFYVLFLGPVLATAFIVGLNPGFEKDILKQANVSLLWWLYAWLHIFWFLIRALRPTIPSGEVAGAAENERVNDIPKKASQIGK